MDLEQIVQQILLTRHDLTREEVLKRIYEKKHSAEGYFLDEVAARIVADELGVEIPREEETFSGEINIKDIVSGLNDVTTTGRVVTVYPVQSFSRSDLSEGKVARLLLQDSSGSLKVVMWDDKVGLVEEGKVQQGQIIRVQHGYAREGFDGRIEMHIGKKGGLEVSPVGIDESRYPQTGDFMDKIGRLKAGQREVNISGVVTRVFPHSDFNRPNGTCGKVQLTKVKDETGEIKAVFWNEKVDQLSDLKNGDKLNIVNARVKEQADGRIELHVESQSQVEKSIGPPLMQPNESGKTAVVRISDLREESGPLAIEATVASSPSIREVTTSQGEKVLLASFDLLDDTGKIGVTLWRKHAELAKALAIGIRIKMSNVYAKKGFSNLLELVSRTSTIIDVVSNPAPASTANPDVRP